jgi:hypothetical protein
MTYELSQIQPIVTVMVTVSDNVRSVRAWFANSTHNCSAYPDAGCFSGRSTQCYVAGYTVFIMAVCRLFLELADVLFTSFREPGFLKNDFDKYISSLNNLMEVILYSTSVAFSTNVFSEDVISPVLWQIGTLSVSAALWNLLVIMRLFPFNIGLYIIMFLKILKTFAKSISVLLILFIMVK